MEKLFSSFSSLFTSKLELRQQENEHSYLSHFRFLTCLVTIVKCMQDILWTMTRCHIISNNGFLQKPFLEIYSLKCMQYFN